MNLKDTLAYEYLLSDYDTILGREARRIFNRNGVQPIASNHALSALCQQLWEQRDLDLHLLITAPDIISEMQNFYL